MSKYQGHSSRAAWNVALYIANDYVLYMMAREAMRQTRTREEAVALLLSMLPEKTPDGYRYTKTSVRAALVGLT